MASIGREQHDKERATFWYPVALSICGVGISSVLTFWIGATQSAKIAAWPYYGPVMAVSVSTVAFGLYLVFAIWNHWPLPEPRYESRNRYRLITLVGSVALLAYLTMISRLFLAPLCVVLVIGIIWAIRHVRRRRYTSATVRPISVALANHIPAGRAPLIEDTATESWLSPDDRAWADIRQHVSDLAGDLSEQIEAGRSKVFISERTAPGMGDWDVWSPDITEEFFIETYKDTRRHSVVSLLRRFKDDYGIEDEELNQFAVTPKTLDDLEFIRNRLLALVKNRPKEGAV